MSAPFTGGCACGDLRYRIDGEPASMVDCQCRQCQKSSGTGHQSHLTFVGAEVSTEGEPAWWECTGDGGTVKQKGFCRCCGSPVYLRFPAMPDVLIVTPASLDAPQRYRPQFVTWSAAAPDWDYHDPVIVRHARMP